MKTQLLVLITGIISLNSFSQPNNALHFDGVDDRIYVGTSPLLNTAHVTVQAWVRLDYIGGWSWRGVVTKRNCCGDGTLQWSMQTTVGGYLTFGLWTDSIGAGVGLTADPDPMPVGIWTNYTGTYDGHEVCFYKNGILIAKDTAGKGNILSTNWPVVIGDRDGGPDWFPGSIDEVRIWDRALTQTEIQNNINCRLTGSETGLVAYYNFNQGIAGGNNTNITILFDQSPNHLDGTLQNFALNGVTSNWISDTISVLPCLPVASIADKSILEDNSGTKQLKFPVTLSNAYVNPVTIKYKTFNGTAMAGSDYVTKQGVLTFNPGDTIKNISITINGDTQPEANEKFLVRIGFPVNATIADDTAIGTIRNDDGAFVSSTITDNIKTNSSSVFIYPNPVKSTLYIQSKQNTNFSLSDATGKVVITKQINGNGSIDVSKLSPGLYFLRNDVSSRVQKIIIENNLKIIKMKKQLLIVIVSLSHIISFAQQNNALHFDGINDRVYVGDYELLNTPHITVQAWVKMDNIYGYYGVVTKRNCCDDFTTFQWSMQTSPDGRISFAVNINDPILYGTNDPNPVEVGVWTNYTATYDGSTVSLYKNGILISSNSARHGDIVPMSWPLIIGARGGGFDWFSGAIDEVRIWDRALSQKEIQANINCTLSGSEPGLIAYYNFNQGIANGNNEGETTLFDKTSNHLDGALQNFALNGTISNWISDDIAVSPCLPIASIADKSILEGNTGIKQLNFPVTLSNAYTSPVKIKYKTFNGTATAGSDYIAKQGVLTFNPGDTVKNISVTINGDTQPEANEKFLVRMGLPQNATIDDDSAIGTIRDDDAAALTNKSATSEKIKSASITTEIIAYPNPAKTILSVQSKQNAIFSLSDATGKVVITKQINGSGNMDVSKLSTGLYFLRNNETGEAQKVVIEK